MSKKKKNEDSDNKKLESLESLPETSGYNFIEATIERAKSELEANPDQTKLILSESTGVGKSISFWFTWKDDDGWIIDRQLG